MTDPKNDGPKIRPLKKRRPTLELDLPAPPPRPKTERETRLAVEGEVGMLMSVGERMKPEGLLHVGSAAIHFYIHAMGPDSYILTQTAHLDAVPETLAVQGSKELARKMMTAYGHEPPRYRDEAPDKQL